MTIIADALKSLIPPTGCKIFALRAAIKAVHDVPANELDYALQGLIGEGGAYVLADGFIMLRTRWISINAAKEDAPYRPSPDHPWKKLLVTQKGRG